jgi:hypothetical protein
MNLLASGFSYSDGMVVRQEDNGMAPYKDLGEIKLLLQGC